MSINFVNASIGLGVAAVIGVFLIIFLLCKLIQYSPCEEEDDDEEED